MNPVIIGNAILYNADCRLVLPQLARPAVVLTDPPYGIDYKSGNATDALWGEDRAIANDHDTECRDAALFLLSGVPALVFGSRKAEQPIGTRATLIWDKGPALGMGALDLPWKPSYEEICVIGKGFEGKRDGAVIYCPPVQSMAKNGREHPNEKPVRLLSMLLDKSPPGLVCDPFMGSGSTGVACAGLGRPFVGMEIRRKHFETACRRIEDAQRQERLIA